MKSEILYRPSDVLNKLALEEVPASEVEIGDLIFAQGYVVLVGEINPIEYGPFKFLEFGREAAPGVHDGYERGVSLEPEDLVKRVPRAWLQKDTILGSETPQKYTKEGPKHP